MDETSVNCLVILRMTILVYCELLEDESEKAEPFRTTGRSQDRGF